MESAGAVAEGGVEYRSAAAAGEANRAASAGGDFREDGVHLAGNNFRDGRETDAVFVTEGKIAEQIADGGQAALFEDCGAMRADASKIFHRICQRDGHAFKGSGQLRMASRNGTRRTFIPLSAGQMFLVTDGGFVASGSVFDSRCVNQARSSSLPTTMSISIRHLESTSRGRESHSRLVLCASQVKFV